MRKFLVTLAGIALFSGPASGQSASDAHVIIISLEGFAASRLEDDELELSSLRGLARSGAWAESSETVFPPTDHPAHTSITTGVTPAVHGVIGNRLLNRETGDYVQITNLPRAESIHAETLFDAAKKGGLTTAAFFWPGTRDDASIDHGIPLVLTGDGKADIEGSDPKFLEELRENNIPIDLFFDWYNDLALQTTADRVLTRAAVHVITMYKPNLLAIRLPAMDRYQHQYGPHHYLSKASFTAADYNVGLIRRAVEQAGIADNTTIFVVSDHGFHAVYYSTNVYPLFERAGLLDKVNLHAGYWSVVVELTDAFDRTRDQAKLVDVFKKALELQGITRVIAPYEFEAEGIPRYEDNPYMLGHYIIMGDFDTIAVLEEDGNSTRRTRLQTAVYGHGYLPSHELMQPVFLAAGRRVKEGVRVGKVHNLDIAPTVCELLGLEMAGVSGRVLEEILEEK